jgi:hypothetical protein
MGGNKLNNIHVPPLTKFKIEGRSDASIEILNCHILSDSGYTYFNDDQTSYGYYSLNFKDIVLPVGREFVIDFSGSTYNQAFVEWQYGEPISENIFYSNDGLESVFEIKCPPNKRINFTQIVAYSEGDTYSLSLNKLRIDYNNCWTDVKFAPNEDVVVTIPEGTFLYLSWEFI